MTGVLGALAVSTAVAADGTCPNGLPFCFSADQPAVAAEVNNNFAQLREWLEAKVGTRGQNVAVTTPATFSSGVTLASTGTFNGATTFNAPATFNAGLSVTGTALDDGYELECFDGESGGNYTSCCRINVRNGATECRVGTSWNLSGWSNTAVGPFAATSTGKYQLTCFRGLLNVVYPGCCRINVINGGSSCAIANNWQLSAWTAVPAPY